MLRRASNRKQMFENYKSYTIISAFKRIADKSEIVTSKIMELTGSEKAISFNKMFEPRFKLLKAFVK